MQYRIPVPNWSKAPWGLSVLARVTSIFTGTSISPDALSRQCSNHYAFRAGRNLPDLTMLLPSALGFSPHPPVSVYGTGTINTIAAFLGTDSTYFTTLISLRITSLAYAADLPTTHLLRLHQSFHSWLKFYPCVPTVLIYCGTGISTCYPSTTSFDLALGPDLPRADQLYSGNLRYSA